jgi:CheY-like chemotaxis protein
MTQFKSFLHDRRVLILEDEYLISVLIEDILKELGCRSVASATGTESALQLISTYEPEFALVDYSIGAGNSLDVAQALTERGVPFAFVTGRFPDDIAKVFSDVPLVSKPFEAADIEDALLRALAASPGTAAFPVAQTVSAVGRR